MNIFIEAQIGSAVWWRMGGGAFLHDLMKYIHAYYGMVHVHKLIYKQETREFLKVNLNEILMNKNAMFMFHGSQFMFFRAGHVKVHHYFRPYMKRILKSLQIS